MNRSEMYGNASGAKRPVLRLRLHLKYVYDCKCYLLLTVEIAMQAKLQAYRFFAYYLNSLGDFLKWRHSIVRQMVVPNGNAS